MDRLECDRMFVAVMETGSFVKAAARLGTSASQASKLVGALEADLGVRLLNRTTRSISPTEAGQSYFQRLRTILDDFDDLDALIRNANLSPRGRLKMTAPVSFGSVELVPALNLFAAQFAEIELDVSFTDRLVNMVDDGFDLAIRIGHPTDSSLIARRLCDTRVVVVASAAYLGRHGRPDTPADLAEHHCVIDTNLRDPNHWVFRNGAGRRMVQPVHGRLRYSNADACLQAAQAGLGLAYLPSFVAAPALRSGSVASVLADFEPEPFGVFALYPNGQHLAAKVRVLVDFLVTHFHNGLAPIET